MPRVEGFTISIGVGCCQVPAQDEYRGLAGDGIRALLAEVCVEGGHQDTVSYPQCV